jgi:uncharacterized protein (DUF362 family)
MDRRRFLLGTTASTVGAALGVTGAARAQAPMLRPGEVLSVHAPGMTRDRDALVAPAARAALDRALMLFTGASDPADALGRYISPDDVVGLKVNALAAPGHPFHKALTWHLVEHLRALGVPDRRIVIFDQYGSRMRRAGYPHTPSRRGVRVLHHRRLGYERVGRRYDAERTLRWSTVLDELTAIVNLCVPKDHDLSGITGALKNLAFGCVDKVPKFHAVIHDAIPWIYSQPEIRDRTRLVICDASRVLYEGGPQDVPKHRDQCNQVLVSEDPVAMDWAILELVNGARAGHGLPPIGAVRPPHFLNRAVAYGLGVPLSRVRWQHAGAVGPPAPVELRHITPFEEG